MRLRTVSHSPFRRSRISFLMRQPRYAWFSNESGAQTRWSRCYGGRSRCLIDGAMGEWDALKVKGVRLAGRPIQMISGCILIVMGVAMITGYLSMFAFWLLKTFPVLSTIG